MRQVQLIVWLFASSGVVLGATYWVRWRQLSKTQKGIKDVKYCFLMGLASLVASVGVAIGGWGVIPFSPSTVGLAVVVVGLGGGVMAAAYFYQAFPKVRFSPSDPDFEEKTAKYRIKRYYDIGVGLATVIASVAFIWFGTILPGLLQS